MRNKKKDLFLDFTSLLDVMMLVLFFFILFSQGRVDSAKQKMEEEKTAANQRAEAIIATAESEIEEARKSKFLSEQQIQENMELKKQLEHDIDVVNQVTSQEANAIVAFNSGNNLKFILQSFGSDAGPATLIVLLNKEEIGRSIVARDTDTEEDIAKSVSPGKLAGWMTAHGIQKDSVVMCDFIYDSSVGRTSKECEKVLAVIKAVRDEQGYKHFYCSETDVYAR